eukprot:967817-Amphidinium_carterae.1
MVKYHGALPQTARRCISRPSFASFHAPGVHARPVSALSRASGAVSSLSRPTTPYGQRKSRCGSYHPLTILRFNGLYLDVFPTLGKQ